MTVRKRKSSQRRFQPTCWKCQKLNLTRAEAVLIAIEYCQRVPVQFGQMDAYFCNYAQSWHLGHTGKYLAEMAAYERLGWTWANPFEKEGTRRDEPSLH